jgi:hypothetical protein
MEQPTQAKHDDATQARRARFMRELINYGLNAEFTFEVCKLVLSICAGALLTLWITGQLATSPGAGGSDATRVAPDLQSPVSGASLTKPGAAGGARSIARCADGETEAAR